MKIIGKILKIFSIFIISAIILCYFSFLIILPKIVNSDKYIAKIEKSLSEKTNFEIKFKNFKFITNPNLTFDIKLKQIYACSDKKEQLANIKNFTYHTSVFNIKNGRLNSDYIFADINSLKKYFKSKEKSASLNFSFFPVTNIKSGKIIFSKNTYANINHIKSQKKFNGITTRLLANIINPYTKYPVTVGAKGEIYYKNKLGFDNFSTKFGNSEVYLTGDMDNLKIKGKNLPARELKDGFLYIYKLKHPNKKNFLENFDKFTGTLDIDLNFAKGKFNGQCITHNLGADFSTLKIPVFLPETTYYFKDKTMTAETQGTFGTEPVTTDVIIKEIGTPELDVIGNVESTFTNRFIRKYYPNANIEGKTPAKVTYHTHDNGTVDVYYYLTIPKGSNLMSVWGDLNNPDKTRRITMHTKKKGIPIVIKEVDYSVNNEKLLYGNGLINKSNGKYTLHNLNLKSNGKVPVNYIRSFLRNYVKNGTFDTDIKLDFIQKTALGSMNLYNVSHGNFLFLEHAGLNIDKDKITILSNGSFYNSPLKASAIIDNKISSEKIHVRNADIHLNSLFIQKGKLESIPKTFAVNKKIKQPTVYKRKKPEIVVEQGRLVIDKVYGRKFDIRNVNFQGSLRNNIANFIIPQAEYAKGLLSAKGIYNIKKHSSDIEFFASDIDSNEVATHMFKLPEQIHGNAFATLHIITKNKFNDIKAKANFAISDGYLPKIGTQEFTIKNSKNKKPSRIAKFMEKHNIKITLSKITNIDFSKPNVFYSNLYGTFNMHNEEVNDIKIFSSGEYTGLYIEGEYNIDTECGDVNIFGKRNKTHAKPIRILKIPVNLIYKIVFRPEHTINLYEDKVKMIPEIKAGIGDEISVFRISANGHFNKSEKLKITFKDLR